MKKSSEKGSVPSVAKHREPSAAPIIVAEEINTSPYSPVGRATLHRPKNEDLIRGLVSRVRGAASACAPVVVA